MILRCRRCGADTQYDGKNEIKCSYCGSVFTLKNVRVIEREAKQDEPSDPLEDFR
jgi:DNA-directed RNA polymerase subunit RPC12/RpoP